MSKPIDSSAAGLIKKALSARYKTNLPDDSTMSNTLRTALANLGSSRDLREVLDGLDAQNVRSARSERARWDEIAVATGTSLNQSRKLWGDSVSAIASRTSRASEKTFISGLSMKDAAELLSATIPSLHNWIGDAMTKPNQKAVEVTRSFNGARISFKAASEPLGTRRRQWRIYDIERD